ncbi:MAG: hypothetical protein PVF17_09730 [Ignavibacteria bacterium]|jgi:hypothetical protein
MAKGVVTTTVPLANDIVYGEFKIYANYEMPSQLELGATQGGCKIDINRVIQEMKFDGAYGPIKGLRRYERIDSKVTLQQLTLKYFNKKKISDGESDGTWEAKDWSATGGTYTAETTIVNSGLQSAKMTADTNQYGIHEVFASAKDLTVFDNNESSDTSDYIGFAIYISTQDKADLGTADLRVSLHCNAENTETDAYYYDVAAADLTADEWTTFKVLKSAFSAIGGGSEDWAAITGVSLKLSGAPSDEVICYIDSIDLIQAQSQGTLLPVNGGGASYTDETTYKEYRPNLTLNDDEYYDNIAVVGQKHDGKNFMFIFKDVLNDGAINAALQEKESVISEVVLTAHYETTKPTTCPIKIRDYQV